MSQYRIISTWKEEKALTCQHCGRAIKNIALLENTVTGERMTVGLTCLGKIMNLNEKFDKAVQTEIKKYYKVVTEFEEAKKDYTLEIEKTENRVSEEDFDNIVFRYLNRADKLIKKTMDINNFSKSGKIQLANINGLKIEYNQIKNQYGYSNPDYKID